MSEFSPEQLHIPDDHELEEVMGELRDILDEGMRTSSSAPPPTTVQHPGGYATTNVYAAPVIQAAPGAYASPSMYASPGTYASLSAYTALGTYAAPAVHTTSAVHAAPGVYTAHGTYVAPDTYSAPYNAHHVPDGSVAPPLSHAPYREAQYVPTTLEPGAWSSPQDAAIIKASKTSPLLAQRSLSQSVPAAPQTPTGVARRDIFQPLRPLSPAPRQFSTPSSSSQGVVSIAPKPSLREEDVRSLDQPSGGAPLMLRRMLLHQQTGGALSPRGVMSPRSSQRFAPDGASPLVSTVDRFRSRESSRCASPEPRLVQRDSLTEVLYTDSERSASEASSGASSASDRSRGIVKKSRRKPRKKSEPGESRLMISSKTCHGCGHVAKARFAACSNVTLGTCRKIFCERCLLKSNTPEQVDMFVSRDYGYICNHCQGMCPPGAQCFYYAGSASKAQQFKASPLVAAQQAYVAKPEAPPNAQEPVYDQVPVDPDALVMQVLDQLDVQFDESLDFH